MEKQLIKRPTPPPTVMIREGVKPGTTYTPGILYKIKKRVIRYLNSFFNLGM